LLLTNAIFSYRGLL